MLYMLKIFHHPFSKTAIQMSFPFIRVGTLCVFVLCSLIGQSIWISMQNLESVAQKMAELWVLLYFLYFCNLFVNGCGRSRSTSKRNFGLVAQKVMINFVYLAAILFFWWPFCFSYFGCEWSRSTSMRKFGLLAQKMSDLATILFFFQTCDLYERSQVWTKRSQVWTQTCDL